MLCELTLGYECNQRCSYCALSSVKNINLKKEKIPLMDIINFIKKTDVTEIRFTGGEPLLYAKEIILIIQNLRPKITFHIVTSLTLWNSTIETMFKLLANYSKKYISVSLDNIVSTKERNIEGVLDNIDKLIKLGIKPTINRVLTKESIKSYKETSEYFKNLGLRIYDNQLEFFDKTKEIIYFNSRKIKEKDCFGNRIAIDCNGIIGLCRCMNTFNYSSNINIYNSIEEIEKYIKETKNNFILKMQKLNLQKFNNCIFNYLYYKNRKEINYDKS